MEKDRLDRLNKLKEEVALYPSVEGETKGLLFNKEAQYQSLEEVKKASLSEFSEIKSATKSDKRLCVSSGFKRGFCSHNRS